MEPLTYAELGRQVTVVVDRLIADVAEDASRWQDLIGLVNSLPSSDFDRVVGALASTGFRDAPEDEVVQVWAALRKVVAHHWEFADADWAMPDEKVRQLFQIYERLTPENPLLRVGWLFSPTPDLPLRGIGSRRADRDEVAEEQRLSAIRELLAEGGAQLVLKLVDVGESPWYVGKSMARLDTAASPEESLRHLLDFSNPRRLEAAHGFLQGTYLHKGERAIQQLLEPDLPWSPAQRAQIYLALPFKAEVFDQLNDEPLEVRQEYWRNMWAHGKGELDPAVVRRAAEELLEQSQTSTAVVLLALYREHFQSDLALRALQQLVATPPSDPRVWQRLGHDVLTLLNGMHEAGSTEERVLAELEWIYLPIMSSVEFGYRPPTLDRALAKSPSLFVDVLKTVYRPHGEEGTEATAEEQTRARQGFELLYRWSTLPGSVEGGLDGAELRSWITDVRELARSARRGEIADLYIGQILAHSPEGEDGRWPHEAVRGVLEELANESVERGFETQVYNNRGITSRAVGEGGAQERELAARFARLSRELIRRWPRTGSVLQRIAQGYETDARREDLRAEVDRSRWE